MLPRKAANFASGQTLDINRVNSGFEQIYRDLLASTSKRYAYSSFELDFTSLASTHTAAAFTFLIKPPVIWEVVGIELVAYEPTAGTATSLSLTNTLTGSKTTTVVPGTSAARGYATSNYVALGAASTEQTFTLAVTGAGYTLGRTYAIVHVRIDRGNAGVTYSTQNLVNMPRVASGETTTAATLNTAFSAYETATTANTATVDRQFRWQVFTMRPVAATILASDRDWRLPCNARLYHSLDVVNYGTAGNDVTFDLLDSSGVTLGFSRTVLGGNIKSQGNVLSFIDPDAFGELDSTKDLTLRISRDVTAPAAIDLAYAVIYFQ